MAPKDLRGINRVAIVGGGPTGIACAKYLLAEKSFQTIDVFEQRRNVGGIWNLSGTEKTRRIPIPQTDPKYGAGKNSSASGRGDDDSLEFESPLYDYLETNIPKTMMAYSDTPFAESLPLYPKHDDVLRYLEDYAQPVKHFVHFQTQVIDVRPFEPRDHPEGTSRLAQKWHLTTKDLRTNALEEAHYDAVIVANGHYTVPHVPAVPGIAEWHKKYPNVVMHSKAYRRPEDFSGQKVLVIGNSASGLDIAGQLAPCAQKPIFLASRSASQLAPAGGGPAWRKDIAEIEAFLVSEGDRAVRTKDGDMVDGFDAIIFATGYFYSFPFLSPVSAHSSSSSKTQSPSSSSVSLESPASAHDGPAAHLPTSDGEDLSVSNPLENLVTSGLRTHDVYKHFIHIDYPTLALPVLNLKVVPFPLAENQAAVIARLWSGRLDLPTTNDMHKWEEDEERRLLEGRRLRPAPDTATGESVASDGHDLPAATSKYEGGFHTLVYPEDVAQINSLYQWAASACPRDGLEHNGKGKLGTRWDEEQVWLRKQFPTLKAAYTNFGGKRFDVTSIAELGEEWNDGYKKWQENTSDEEKANLFRRAAVPGY
ncbi:monooxygenase [Exophiala xenobiotica]|uniref:Monooxygenase n=1 Tax=Lithohypha guttulata TaxID=1690604 RepID=A0ABR0JZR0_9EURO|nr:monooxygenase [Lithohypha guttulata]KAK5311438.1 monooxygenase [Exophiala xenobiotica]